MLDNLLERESELLDRLDNLEGCEDNPVYAQEIKKIREELDHIYPIINTELF